MQNAAMMASSSKKHKPMKNVFKVALVAAAMLSFTMAQAQTHKDSTIGHKIGRTAKKVGNKTAELGAKGAATITDKKYDDKAGPHGEAVYINKHGHYFYVNKTGHKVYLKKSQLKNEHED